MNPTQKGDVAQAMITARFLRLGWSVLKPLSESCRYDLVIDRFRGFERVQCKTGRLRRGSVHFDTCSKSVPHMGGGRKSYVGEVDLFGVYCPETDECYLVPISEASRFLGVLRVDKLKINKKGVKFAKDYVI